MTNILADLKSFGLLVNDLALSSETKIHYFLQRTQTDLFKTFLFQVQWLFELVCAIKMIRGRTMLS